MSLTVGKVRETLEKAGLADFFTPQGLEALTQFSLQMLQVNQTLNLTRWTSEDDFLSFHILDSAYALPSINPLVRPSDRWMDLGTGSGFPGVLLMAAFPQAEFTLMDSVGKKTKALESCYLEAGLKGHTLIGRAEALGQDPRYRERWKGITTRAVADFQVVLEYAMPLLKVGGYLVNWMTEAQLKTVDKAENAQKLLHCKIIKIADYSLPSLNQSRSIVIVEKLGKTSSRYPRPIGQPSKNPL